MDGMLDAAFVGHTPMWRQIARNLVRNVQIQEQLQDQQIAKITTAIVDGMLEEAFVGHTPMWRQIARNLVEFVKRCKIERNWWWECDTTTTFCTFSMDPTIIFHQSVEMLCKDVFFTIFYDVAI